MDDSTAGSEESSGQEIETPDLGSENSGSESAGADLGDELSDANYRAEMKEAGIELDDETPEDQPDLEKMKEEFENPEEPENKEESEEGKKDDKKSDEKDAENDQKTLKNTKITLKVNGEEKEYTDINEIQQLAQHGIGANQKMQEAAVIRKKAETLFNDIKENPFEVLQHKSFGLNVRDLAEQYLFGQIKRDGMTQEQRDSQDKGLADSRELANYRRKQNEQQNEQSQQNEQQNHTKLKQQFTGQIKANLESGSLPVTDWTSARMAGYMRQALSKGLQPTQAQLVEIVRNDWAVENRAFLSQMQNPEDIISAIGDDTMNRVRKHQVSKFKTGTKKPKVISEAKPRGEKRQTFSTTEEMREAMLAK